MSGGSFNVAGELRVGYIGQGTFIHTGGTVTIGTPESPGELNLGYYSGTFNLSSDAANLIVWGDEYIGSPYRGAMFHTAGSHVVSGSLNIGGYNSEYQIARGSLTVGGMELIGIFGSGSFLQSGGSNAAGVSVAIGPQGSYELSGGSLTTPALDIGDLGSFTWSGGSLVADSLLVVGSFTVAAGAQRTLHVDSLNVTISGKLDLNDNRLIIDYTDASPIDEVRSMLADGRLFSSLADASHGLGYAEAGAPVGGSVLVEFTVFGDADLDADVDLDDVGQWAVNFTGDLGGIGADKFWFEGDWDYDGDVDLDDVGKWSTNFTGELGGSGAGSVLVVDSPVAPEAIAILAGMGITVVPEPAALAAITCIALLSSAGRSRSRRRNCDARML
jgi:hypothetical protein